MSEDTENGWWDYIEREDSAKKEEPKCPDCGGTNLEIQGHCINCLDCGFSLCSL
jgi:hypothetical protein